MLAAPLLALLLAAAPQAEAPPLAYPVARHDSARVERPRAGVRIARHRRTTLALGATVPGYLSSRGLPPRAGQVVVTDTGLVFRSADGRHEEAFPVVGPVRIVAGRPWRASTVSLAYVDEAAGEALYVFRLDAGVFQTGVPGPLLELVERPAWVDSLANREWPADRPLVGAGQVGAARELTARIMSGSYADTLYALFGRPARPVGRVGERGRKAGRLGEYVPRRDSLALDPTRMTSHDQLRHTLAHELGHRWQSRAPGQLRVLWRGIPAIRDPRRYGHGSVPEQQAEAIAFAVHFLQATAGMADGPDARRLLDQYELMLPGTGTMVRYFALQPIYAGHPLRSLLTHGPA